MNQSDMTITCVQLDFANAWLYLPPQYRVGLEIIRNILCCNLSWFFLSIFLSCSFVTVSDLFCYEFYDTFVLLLPIKSLVTSVVVHYYINLRSSIISCLFFEIISFFRYFFITLICKFPWSFLSWTSSNFYNSTVVRLSYRVSNFITNQITSCLCCFLNYPFWSSFQCICWRLFIMIKTFLAVFATQLYNLLVFLPIFLPIFLAKDKNP